MKTTRERRRRNILLAWIRGSVILQMLDRLSERIYRSFGAGFFGWLLTGYPAGEDSLFASLVTESPIGRLAGRIRHFINRQIEESLVLLMIRSMMRRFLRCRMRIFGIYFLSFGSYTAAFSLISAMAAGADISVSGHPALLFAIVMICFAVPLLLSKATLRETLCTTYAGDFILRVLGYSVDEVLTAGEGEPVGRMNIAFLAGILSGVMTYRVEPWWIFGALILMLCAYLVLCKPEIGVMALFFGMPILPTMALAGLVIYVFLCLGLKVLRGKRIIHVEPLDIMVIAFGVILFFGGFVSLSPGSLKPAMLLTCLLIGYFEVVWLIRERAWLNRCAAAGVISATLVSLYGIFQYVTGTALMAEAWVDSDMFEDIAGRAVGTLENPNMFGEYLIMLIPLAAVMLVGHGEGLRRTPAFVCLGVMGVCLILTWSRGAWLGLMAAVILFVFIWHRRAVWLLFAGVASIPLLPYVLPASIIQRFTSIGNLADSSTSYRVFIWRAACDMIRDLGFTGIGIGEEAWDRVYPLYAYMGVEAAPHSHNLYLQIWLETGVCGLIVFVLILFFLFQSLFTLCRDLQNARQIQLIPLEGEDMHSLSGTDYNRLTRKTKSQLRLTGAAALSGIFAVMVQGMTDYAWYNYRVYLMFWLMLGLTSAYIRSGRSMLMRERDGEEDRAALDLPYRSSRYRSGGQVKKAPVQKSRTSGSDTAEA